MYCQSKKILGIALLGFAMLATTAQGAILASDSSSDPAYDGVTSTIYGLDGGTGFGAWSYYYGETDALSVTEPYQVSLDPSFCVTNNEVYAGIAQRTIDTPLGQGDVFSASLDVNPYTDGGVGVYFYDSGYSYGDGQRRLIFTSDMAAYGTTNWGIYDGDSSFYDTGIPRDAGPLDFSMEVTGTTTYTLSVVSQLLDTDGVTPLYSYSQSGNLGGIAVNGIDRFKLASLSDVRGAAYSNLSVIYGDGTTAPAYDNATDSVYTKGLTINGQNGGAGFGAWEVTGGDTAVNTYGDYPFPFDDTAFKVAWCTTNLHNVAARTIDDPLDTGDTFSIDLKKSKVSSGGSDIYDDWCGVFLYNSDNFTSSNVRLQFGDSQATGTGNWCIWDRTDATQTNYGTVVLDTGIAADDTPIHVEFTVTGTETYDLSVSVWDKWTGEYGDPQVFTDLPLTNQGLGALDCFRIYNMKGCGELLFDNIEVADATNPQIRRTIFRCEAISIFQNN